jgi:hypothetical protein
MAVPSMQLLSKVPAVGWCRDDAEGILPFYDVVSYNQNYVEI